MLPELAVISQADEQPRSGSAEDGRINESQANPENDLMQSTPIQNNPVSPNPGDAPQRIPYWLQQAERLLRVIVRIYLGLLVCFAPWFPPAWDQNPLFASSPAFLHFVGLGAVRGVISGLGLLNLWIALRDAMRNPADRDQR